MAVALQRIGEYEIVEADVDAIGHMSVRRYAEIVESIAAVAVGGAQALTAVRWITEMVTRQHREQLLGARLTITACVVATDSHTRTFHIELRNDANGELASTHRVTVGQLDAVERLPIPLATDSGTEATVVAQLEYARPRRLGTVRFAMRTLADFNNRTIETWSDRVLSTDECDADGWFSGGATQLAWGLPSAPRAATQWQFTTADGLNFALADVEHRRWLSSSPPRLGTHLRTLSANVAIERNRRVRREWTFDIDSGTLHAIGEFVDLLVDLAVRRAADVPDEIRALLAAHLHPDLGDDTQHDPLDPHDPQDPQDPHDPHDQESMHAY